VCWSGARSRDGRCKVLPTYADSAAAAIEQLNGRFPTTQSIVFYMMLGACFQKSAVNQTFAG
jgi:hypothetical protein